MTKTVNRTVLLTQVLCVLAWSVGVVSAQSGSGLADRIQQVMRRPEFVHSSFGIEVLSLDTGNSVYSLNAEKLFVSASTTKLLTEGAALKLLGSNFHFHSRVYRTGAIKKNGVLAGDVVLLGSGDPNLSGRIQPDDTVIFDDEDHSYGGRGTKGIGNDPLLVIHELAQQIAAKGIRDAEKRDIQEVLDWSDEYAASLDPLSDLPDSIDDFVHPEKKYPWLT